MKTKYIYLIQLALIGAMFIVSCSDDVDHEPSPITNPNSTNVYFAEDETGEIILDIEDNSINITVCRGVTTQAQTVGLYAEALPEGLFVIPESVTFQAGEAEKEITIEVKEVEYLKNYRFALLIEDDQTRPYANQNVYGRLQMNIVKEDFSPYAEGVYTSRFAGGSWETVLEYSPSTTLYRFKDCWVEGYDVLFRWSEETFVFEGTVSGDATVVPTGLVEGAYGAVSAHYINGETTYDSANTTFTFGIEWVVSEGTFGVYLDTFKVTNFMQN